MEPYVSIVILNYNGKEYIFDCINSVFKTTGCNFEVILIDNNSTDQSSDYCKEKFPELIESTNFSLISMPMVWSPALANDNAVGRPILPIPTIQTFKDCVSKEFRPSSILFISILPDFSKSVYILSDYTRLFKS